jgi:hypothetical protein
VGGVTLRVATLSVVLASRVTGQGVVAASRRVDTTSRLVAATPVGARELRATHDRRVRADDVTASRPAPWWAPVASVVVPGSGQLVMRQPRAAAFLGIEAYEWIQLLESTRNAHDLRSEYRRIAREVARSNVKGPRPDGSWAYYESMEEYPASGSFNLGTGADIVPETDETTFNGALWRKARGIFWVDADSPPPRTDASFQKALDFYLDQAVRDEFAWTWKNAQISQAEYSNTILRYNRATRDVRNALGIILANHLVSGIDALATVRIHQSRTADGARRIEVTVPLGTLAPKRSHRP